MGHFNKCIQDTCVMARMLILFTGLCAFYRTVLVLIQQLKRGLKLLVIKVQG